MHPARCKHGAAAVRRCPPLLTVHVKRFQQDMRGRLSKIEGAVPFPLTLDLSSFCDPQVCCHPTGYLQCTMHLLPAHIYHAAKHKHFCATVCWCSCNESCTIPSGSVYTTCIYCVLVCYMPYTTCTVLQCRAHTLTTQTTPC